MKKDGKPGSGHSGELTRTPELTGKPLLTPSNAEIPCKWCRNLKTNAVDTAFLQIDSQQGPAAWHREPCSIFCNNQNGKRACNKNGGLYMCN